MRTSLLSTSSRMITSASLKLEAICIMVFFILSLYFSSFHPSLSLHPENSPPSSLESKNWHIFHVAIPNPALFVEGEQESKRGMMERRKRSRLIHIYTEKSSFLNKKLEGLPSSTKPKQKGITNHIYLL